MLIYKITNKVNNKCYIGQTIKTAQERWKEHQQHAFGNHPNDINKTLYKAMRKYGLENFIFEVLQDNIETYEQLDKAEIYWIDYYKTRSARKTALNFGIDHSTVDDILNQNNIPRFSFRQATGQRIMISKDDFYKEFDSVKDCAEWFVANKICRTTKVESARTGLKAARAGNGYYCGYLIENI